MNSLCVVSVVVDLNQIWVEATISMPGSDKKLNSRDIETRIKKTENEISHLRDMFAHRNTHGGKRFRARKISIENNIDHAQKRLSQLNIAHQRIQFLND